MAALTPSHTLPPLVPVSSFLTSISTPHIHPILLPLSPLTLLHAIRVSLGTLQVQGGKRRPLLQSVVLVWILLFGGWSIINIALGIPSPLLDPDVQWTAFIYAAVHVVLTITGLGSLGFKALNKDRIGVSLDVFFSLVDGVCRMEGIALLGVEPVSSQPSALTPVITSILIGGGAPLLIGLFDLTSPEWKLRTPDWLVNPTGLLAFDIWSSGFVGWLYAQLTQPDPLLSKPEAQLLCAILLSALMIINRLRVESLKSTPTHAKTTKKATKKPSQSTPSHLSATSLLLYAGVLIPLAVFGLQTVLSDNSALDTLTKNGVKAPTSILLLVSHPDDEVMFFSPILHTLLSSPPLQRLEALSLSTGNSPPDYLGSIRAKEFTTSFEMFNSFHTDHHVDINSTALDHEQLQDGMRTRWSATDVIQAVVNHTQGRSYDWIITFDSKGISSHPNHIDLSIASSLLTSVLHGSPEVWHLQSTPSSILWKYTSLPGAIITHLVSNSRCLNSISSWKEYTQSLYTMRTAHQSQFVWFRWLYWVFSQHVWRASICPVDLNPQSKK
ncbi:unnamed protein product [Sympodiomycopsis kandeliae]